MNSLVHTHPTIKDPDRDPILNDPWVEPTEHWHWDGSTDQITPEHRASRRPSRPSNALGLDPDVVSENDEPYKTINEIREYVTAWRQSGFRGTPARKLLVNWHDRANDGSNEIRSFFCQREAVETLTWLFTKNPVDKQVSLVWDHLSQINSKWNDGLRRVAIKMATGAGKTRTMAMFRAVLETIHPDGCHILVITPNLTVTDRLEELKKLQTDSAVVPISHRQNQPASLTIKNYHKFSCQDRRFDSLGQKPRGIQKKLLKLEEKIEDPAAMLDRVLQKDDGLPLYVFQDEGHHCRRDQVESGALAKEELDDVKQWYTTLLALNKHRNLQGVIDFSATPAYLSTDKELKTPLFPWCITDYCVEDAQEAGICKIARLPYRPDEIVQDKRLTHLYEFCRGKGYDQKWKDEPPQEVKDVFKLLADDWSETRLPVYEEAKRTPAIIAVVNRVDNAKLLYQWLAGTKKDSKWVPGRFDEFSNIDRTTGKPHEREQLPTLLVHSKIGDPDGDDASMKNVIDEQLEIRAPEKSRVEARDEIRGIFQTVGKTGEPGEHIRCVISVAMLSEGWDAKTVTHVFGYRAFGSTLLCEQVIGRALRRPSLDEPETAEYAEVFGVPYPGLRGINVNPPPPRVTYDVFSVPEQAEYRLAWPAIERFELQPGSGERFHLCPSKVSAYDLVLPEAIEVDMRPPDGAGERRRLSTLSMDAREQIVLYQLARRLSDRCINSIEQEGSNSIRRRGALFVDSLHATLDWCNHDLISVSSLASLTDESHQEVVVNKVLESCVFEKGSLPKTVPIWQNSSGSGQPQFIDTERVNFQTSLEDHYPEVDKQCSKSELNLAACHSRQEALIARFLDSSPLVRKWVRNFRLDWRIPWWDQRTHQWREYEPDFLIELQTSELTLVVLEMKGIESEESEQKKIAAELWCGVLSDQPHQTVPGNWYYALVNGVQQVESELMKIG